MSEKRNVRVGIGPTVPVGRNSAAHRVGGERAERCRAVIDFEAERDRMVDRQIRRRGIEDPDLLRAFREVPREEFVPVAMRDAAYHDGPIPIGEGQTISQPYIVALTLAELDLDEGDRVLDVGTGSGYAAAVMSRIVSEVYGIERHEALAEEARMRFRSLGYDNITVTVGDGSVGWPEHAPYDAIAVAAAAPSVPDPLVEQLAVGGNLVLPTGSGRQHLVRIRRTSPDSTEEDRITAVRFVPLVGEAGWSED